MALEVSVFRSVPLLEKLKQVEIGAKDKSVTEVVLGSVVAKTPPPESSVTSRSVKLSASRSGPAKSKPHDSIRSIAGDSDSSPRFVIVLSQSFSVKSYNAISLGEVFKIFEGAECSASEEHFENVTSLLRPILGSGVVPVTRELLSKLVLPSPKPLAQAVPVVLEELAARQHPGEDLERFVRHDFGATLLHSSCKAKDHDTVRKLLEKGADVCAQEEETGDTPLHTAASHCSKCLDSVLDHAGVKFTSQEMKLGFVNQPNKRSLSPLQLAVKCGNPGAVRSLVKAGADVAVVSPEDGDNLFHLAAMSKNAHLCIPVLNSSIGSGPDDGSSASDGRCLLTQATTNQDQVDFEMLNAPNRNGDTPLMAAVRKGNVDSALSLLVEGADPNAKNTLTLVTPLGIAAASASLSLVKLLLVFDASIDIPANERGQTPLEVANSSHEKGADDCAVAIKAVESGHKKFQSVSVVDGALSLVPLTRKSKVLLSLDGGGIRGLVLAQVLMAVEKRMKKLNPKGPPIASYFDWVVGTSTGSYLGLAMTHYKASPALCRKIYLKFKDQALAGSRVYPAENIEESLREAFGAVAKMADITEHKICLTTCTANFLPAKLRLIRNYGKPSEPDLDPSKIHVWEAARASSAAPTYFPAFLDKFIDGGVMANNPTIDAMTEMYQEGDTIGCVVSLGTGITAPVPMEDISMKPGLSPATLLHDAKALVNLINIFIDQSTDSDGQEVNRARAWCKSIGAKYFRLSPHIESVPLDESNTVKIVNMLFDTLLYTFDNVEEIDELVNVLASKHRESMV